MNALPQTLDSRWILAQRPPHTEPDPTRPYAALVEPEAQPNCAIEPVAAIFTTNKQCPFRCLMCDLWKYTISTRQPDGAVAAQVEQALATLPFAAHVKVYNAGNFFDNQSIPPADRERIARLLHGRRTLIVENHPRLVDRRVIEFGKRIADRHGLRMEVAMGLETIDPAVLPRLNKQMTLDDFARATEQVLLTGGRVRAFILLKTPYQDEAGGLEWACRSIEWAQKTGVECCTLIPTRAGNGALDALAQHGQFSPPTLVSLEAALAFGLRLGGGRVFADVWDADNLAQGPHAKCCLRRIRAMNLLQRATPTDAEVDSILVRHP